LRKLHWGNALALGCLLDFLAVLIHSSKKEGRLACHSTIPRDHIAEYNLVSVTDVRTRIGVRNCSSNKIFR
jgi:hypothetical protein